MTNTTSKKVKSFQCTGPRSSTGLSKMFHLLLDVRAEAARASMVFQRDNISPCDNIDTIDTCLFQLERVKNLDGMMLDEFSRKFHPLDETFDGILLDNVAEGEEGFQADREDLLVANIAHT
eukprot:FR743929.1.p2 GENE.FR743929.1~~FR743929.1.p2  ORF type:complete len:121 (+),score=13.38 FR743929.1:208-570(+)